MIVLDVVAQARSGGNRVTLKDLVDRDIPYIPQARPVGMMLNDLQQKAVPHVFAVNEEGGVTGMISIQDIAETIIGDWARERPQERPALRDIRGGVECEARVDVDVVAAKFGVSFDKDGYDTVGGLVVKCAGRVGATNWFPTDATVGANAGYVLFLPQDHGAVKITALGMVQTNSVTMQVPYNSIPWVGLAYDVTLDMRQSGLTNLFSPPRTYSSFNYDYADSQETLGGTLWYAEYYIDNWGTGTTNFFPSVAGADKLEAGKGYLLFFSSTRSGTGVWTCVKPY